MTKSLSFYQHSVDRITKYTQSSTFHRHLTDTHLDVSQMFCSHCQTVNSAVEPVPALSGVMLQYLEYDDI